jgi:uncharacterized Fe-S center protein
VSLQQVFFGSARQAALDAGETLPAKLDIIIDRLQLRDRVHGEQVCIKMHLGGNLGYSTVHPVFVRRVVQAVKDGGVDPFVTDTPDAVATAASRGYTEETLGCRLMPTGGKNDEEFVVREYEFKGMREWRLGRAMAEATFLIDLAHVKGHPSCGFGAAHKNLALGAYMGATRGKMHDTMQFDQYWFPEHANGDPAVVQKIIDSCPVGGLVGDRENAGSIHLHPEQCNQCGQCLDVAPAGSLRIQPENFWAFQEANAIAVKLCLDTFAPEKRVFINLATHMTPVCDCFGFTGLPVLRDIGIFGANDIVAIDEATLDAIAREPLIVENVPLCMQTHVCHDGQSHRAHGPLHPWQQLHGPYKDPYGVPRYSEALGNGSRAYELVDVLPVRTPQRIQNSYVAVAAL